MRKLFSVCLVLCLVGMIITLDGNVSNGFYKKSLSDGINDASSLLSRVVAQGNGSSFSFIDSFFFGFGWCAGLVVLLDEDGYIKITPLDDSMNSTILEGEHKLFIFGFIGYQEDPPGVNINGLALLVLWA